MSETQSEAVVEAPVETPAPVVETNQETAAPEQQAAEQAPQRTADEVKQDEIDQKSKEKISKRFSTLTRSLSEKQREIETLRRQNQEAQALLDAQRGADDPLVKHAQPPDVDARARELIAEREFDEKRLSLVQGGAKEFGQGAWTEKTEILHGLGATQNPAFMQALVELPNAAKLVAHLADDADALVALLRKSPVAMAAEMGRMDAEISRQPTRTVSNAPKPVTPVDTPRVVSEPTAYDENLTMEQYVALRRKTAPRHLGGAR